jgi:UDP-N-acetylglucosamine 2-epimerase (non-hydrolysing)
MSTTFINTDGDDRNRDAAAKPVIGCIIGTRPECIKMAPVVQALRRRNSQQVLVISTGQHRELVQQTLAVFSIRVDVDLNVMTKNQSPATVSARVFEKLDVELSGVPMDLMMVQGDTTSVMVAALCAFYRQIPVAHVEAGLRTHNLHQPFPEELNRVVTSLVTSLHFAPTERARQNLLLERVPEQKIVVTGNTVIDALLQLSERELPCAYPSRLGRRLILVTAHRRENFGERLRSICAAIKRLHDWHGDLEFVYPVHPNPNVRAPVYQLLSGLERVHLIDPVDYVELVALMKASFLIMTDSGGIQEEAPALSKPVLVMRNETERPEAIEAGVAVLVGTNEDLIVSHVDRLLTDERAYRNMAQGASPYGDGRAAERIADACERFLLAPARTLTSEGRDRVPSVVLREI